ncbi:HD-GYP domain-containing protein (c-di-GMP phosphodiesterase class II) [Halanaerobium saccharolyticum]|uniref:HD-GYP domain-containing protein (C-di-GMP phosphodiesterase class II) n=1 Tax=Halanaerobium saccharolyticum TaxID=43595 RepID=A0A4R7YMQ4_9FIRM|nr:HD-GYP domain-containing protein [Halanaerobium saccharolyticum]RAK08507.1 HD-GYP domain-containing protein (c-di-GMP phosphodiesterase class II) [Halanaerobium saccharolyticum]TDV97919.1 HD-GYP domain-containing protein (c-di-GMP phosphodiesterase class II) [Halanaerobium saccharolyticum]TDX59999.1 HD-GYP domain-containing protein (c-di-GMP phosphodiesterase class II) [Halanaerobium saccharolyticum]
MRLVLTENLKEDMELAKPIYEKGNVLLNKGVKNLYKYKKKLLELGIKHLYIEDKYSYNIEINEAIKDSTRRNGKKIVTNTFDRIKNGFLDLNTQDLKGIVEDITDELVLNEDVLLNLVSLKSTSDYTYEHSVNVSVVCIALGKMLGYSKNELFKLGMGGMLHDIGKTLIPEEILNKPGSLTDYEYQLMKNHPELGFNYLQQIESISPLSRIVVYSHHERVDGSGYPRGLKENGIHEFARVAAIADVFDALTSDRVYRDRWPTYKAAEYIMNHTEELFDYQLVKKFLPQVSFYPNGSEVILSSGHRAVVKDQNVGFPTRPVLRLIEDDEGNELDKELDLLKHMNIVITKVIV